MKVVTLRGTYEIDMQRMKVRLANGKEGNLNRVPSPVIGERMQLEMDGDSATTEPVTEVEL